MNALRREFVLDGVYYALEYPKGCAKLIEFPEFGHAPQMTDPQATPADATLARVALNGGDVAADECRDLVEFLLAPPKDKVVRTFLHKSLCHP